MANWVPLEQRPILTSFETYVAYFFTEQQAKPLTCSEHFTENEKRVEMEIPKLKSGFGCHYSPKPNTRR